MPTVLTPEQRERKAKIRDARSVRAELLRSTLRPLGHRMQWVEVNEPDRAYALKGTCRFCGATVSVGSSWTSSGTRLDAREARCMEPGTLDPERLQPGDRFLRNYRDQLITVEILRAREPWTDRFGREMFRYWARRSDTGAEGWMPFGPGAAPLWVAPELAP